MCGCCEAVKWNGKRNRWNTFIHGHYTRIDCPSKRSEIAKKISNSLMGRKRPYMVGKNNPQYGKKGKLSPVFGKDKYAKEKIKPAPLCACGCGGKTKWGHQRFNKYIKYHRCRIDHPMSRPEVRAKISGKNSCMYGKTGSRHPLFGVKHTEQWKREVSKKLKGNQNGLGSKRSPEFRRRLSKIVTERMLGGQAAYMSSRNKSPSRPQVELFKRVKSLFPQAQLNHQSLNRVIDVAIPNLMIAIEYDGSYWHQDEKGDKIRQQELEAIGWKFIRYKDYVPTVKELNKNIFEN
jgi:hypothetical protein